MSVVIPTLNGMPLIKECLEKIAEQEFPGGFEIVVIDSGSTDGTEELAQAYGKLIRIPQWEFNHGLTRNLAIYWTRGELIALIVQDAAPADANWLKALVDAFEDSNVAGAFSRQVPRQGCPPLIRARLERWSASRDKRQVKRVKSEDELQSLSGLEQVGLLSFDNVSSCIRRSAWEEVPFEKRDFGEDTGWAKSVLLKGYSLVFEPRSTVFHSHHNSLWYESKRVYLDHQNWNQLIGLQLFHRPGEVIEASLRAIPERWKEISTQDLNGLSGLYWKLYAIPYSFSQNLAQYMGSHSNRWMDQSSWFRRLNKLLRKGV